MDADEVPLSMKEARDEVLLALACSSEANAKLHCNRAASLLTEAVHSLKTHPAVRYDWSLLREDSPAAAGPS